MHFAQGDAEHFEQLHEHSLGHCSPALLTSPGHCSLLPIPPTKGDRIPFPASPCSALLKLINSFIPKQTYIIMQDLQGFLILK